MVACGWLKKDLERSSLVLGQNRLHCDNVKNKVCHGRERKRKKEGAATFWSFVVPDE